MKYKDWLDVWFANYIEPSSKTKTCERYSEIIEKHLKVKLGEYELEELSPIVIQKYITELMQSGNLTTGKGLAANSVNGMNSYSELSETCVYARRTERVYDRQNQTTENERERSILFFACRTEEDRAGGVIE